MMKKTDGRKNANVKKGDVFQMQWTDAAYVPTFLNDLINSFGPGQRVLNGCCGNSPIGQVRYDIDPKTNRTMDGNLKDQLELFSPGQFDFYYIDAPDSFFNPFGKFIADNYFRGISGGKAAKRKYGDPYQWQYDALKIPTKALILQRNLIMTNWPQHIAKNVEYGLIRDSRPMGRILEIIWKK